MRSGSRAPSFNSLFGILRVRLHVVRVGQEDFQLPFRDSSPRPAPSSPSGCFQLPFRDSPPHEGGQGDLRPHLSTPFSGFHPLVRDAVAAHLPPFNSLFGIPNRFRLCGFPPSSIFQLPFRDSLLTALIDLRRGKLSTPFSGFRPI